MTSSGSTNQPAQPTPSIPHPGNIPSNQVPGPVWRWSGKPPVGVGQGNWYNENILESLYNDMNNTFHRPPWDYRMQGEKGK